MRNSIGPETVPWGTLLITWDIVEVAPFAVIQVPTFPPILSFFQFVA